MRRKAFTLLELIVTIAIITVLGVITMLGVRHVQGRINERRTQSTLMVCRDMLGRFRAHGYALVPQWFHGGVLANHAQTSYAPPFWHNIANPTFTSPPSPQSTLTAIGQMDSLDWSDELAANTIIAFSEMARVSDARALLAALPADHARKFALVHAGQTFSATIPIDAWGNPILFVPATGFQVVANGPVRSSLGLAPMNPIQQWPAVGSSAFFVSAGPDGRFNTEDDLYSFQVDSSSAM